GTAVAESLYTALGRSTTHVVITHAHWDHCFGTPAFAGAEVFGHRGIADGTGSGMDPEELAADAVRYGVAPREAAEAARALVRPDQPVDQVRQLDLGGVTVTLLHPGPAHTGHDLAVVVHTEPVVVFCGDLVEE